MVNSFSRSFFVVITWVFLCLGQNGPAWAVASLGQPCTLDRSHRLDVAFREIENVHDFLVDFFGREPPEEYQAMITAAARSFRLPEAFLTCLFVRESGGKWDAQAKSDAGAVGLAQLMPAPIEDIHSIINLPPGSASGESRAAVKKRLSGVWRTYWENGLKRPVPLKFDQAEALKPESAIGAGALWVRYYLEILKSEGPWNLTPMDLLMLTSGAYNRGVNTFVKECKGLGVAECVQRMRRRSPETYHHMGAVRRCMERAGAVADDTQTKKGNEK
ncbi:MAG: transglycosylase SLT domain-containing protein [Oligoflexia bacterium]|nr:transglycosylase SLT domain-containing protein [Oligoflexia bacterium]